MIMMMMISVLCEDGGCYQARLTVADVQYWQCEPSDSDWCLIQNTDCASRLLSAAPYICQHSTYSSTVLVYAFLSDDEALVNLTDAALQNRLCKACILLLSRIEHHFFHNTTLRALNSLSFNFIAHIHCKVQHIYFSHEQLTYTTVQVVWYSKVGFNVPLDTL